MIQCKTLVVRDTRQNSPHMTCHSAAIVTTILSYTISDRPRRCELMVKNCQFWHIVSSAPTEFSSKIFEGNRKIDWNLLIRLHQFDHYWLSISCVNRLSANIKNYSTLFRQCMDWLLDKIAHHSQIPWCQDWHMFTDLNSALPLTAILQPDLLLALCSPCRPTTKWLRIVESDLQPVNIGLFTSSRPSHGVAHIIETGSVYCRHFFWGGGNSSPNRLPIIVYSKSFFGWDNELQIYHRNFLLMDNKHRKSFVIKQSKQCKLPKLHKNTFGGWALPGPAGGAYVHMM